VSDDVTVAEMNELDSCNADSPPSVIGPDHTSVVSSVDTSAQPPSDDSNVIVSAASVNDSVECTATKSGVVTESELISSSPSKLVIDSSSDAGDHCDVQNAVKAESLETVNTDTVAVCETVDEIGAFVTVVTESIADTFPSPPTEPDTAISGDNATPDATQLLADSVEKDDAAD